jgi:MraZ protein
MYQLTGTYPCKFDAKGRLRLPSAFLDQVPEDERDLFVIKRGLEQCLELYPKKVWDTVANKVSKLNDFNKRNREFKRHFFFGVDKVKRDAADRLNFPNHQLNWANIKSDVVFYCVHDKVEIWDTEVFEQKMQEVSYEDMADLAEEVLGESKDDIPQE